MYGFKHLSQTLRAAQVIEFDKNSRFVLMSDCHRGDNSWADDFAKNQSICCAALEHYYDEHYIYIEIGDGDELWENKRLSTVTNAHKDVFLLLSRFYGKERMVMLYGNHDIVKKNYKQRKKEMFRYFEPSTKECTSLFNDICIKEALVLKDRKSGNEIFITHGHQVDFLNNSLWRLSRFLVKHLWRRLELFGVNDPTSAASNYRKKDRVEKKLSQWASKENCLLIAGHTHRPVFPDPGEPRYFNDGSCVHPNSITAIEIAEENITLVKWLVKARYDGTLFIGRDVLAGPAKIQDYFDNTRAKHVMTPENGCTS